MKKRILGASGIEVSPVGMGCMALSHGYGQIPEESYSIEAIQKAFAFGCNFFDTAEVYGAQLYYAGHNEEIVGKALKDVRKDAVIATKLFLPTEEYKKAGGAYPVLKAHVERSLEHLQTDYIDLYYLHRTNADVPNEEVAEGMGRLIKEGLIRGWGMSQVEAETMEEVQKITPLSAVQNLYNMLERDCEKAVFPYCIENNICVVPFSPVASGFLSGKINVNTEFEKVDDVRNWVPQLSRENIVGNQPIIEVLNTFASRKNATNAQISMAWMLKKYPNCVPIPGSKNQGRILENLASRNVELSDEEFSELESALSKCKIYGHRGNVEGAGARHENHR